MRVKGKAVVDVEITPFELVSTLREKIYSKLNLPGEEGRGFVKGGRWVHEKTVYTTHSSRLRKIWVLLKMRT